MVFNPTRNSKPELDFSIQLDDNIIQRVNSISFLGVVIDDKLSWASHVNYIHGKLSMSVGMMNKLRSVLPLKTLFTLYNALVLPHLDYCNLVWGGASSCHLNRLSLLQKKAIRICSNSHYLAHTPPLFKELNTVNLYDKIKLKTGLFMYSYINNLLPTIFTDYFNTVGNIHNLNTRQKHNIFLPSLRLKLRQNNSIKWKAATLWNSIDSSFKTTTTLNKFKYTFKQHILANYG